MDTTMAGLRAFAPRLGICSRACVRGYCHKGFTRLPAFASSCSAGRLLAAGRLARKAADR